VDGSLLRNRDFRLVSGSVGLGAAAAQGLALALPALWLSFAFFLACSLAGGVAGLLILLRRYRGWVPTSPVGPSGLDPPLDSAPAA
jgi:hypothetical protein